MAKQQKDKQSNFKAFLLKAEYAELFDRYIKEEKRTVSGSIRFIIEKFLDERYEKKQD